MNSDKLLFWKWQYQVLKYLQILIKISSIELAVSAQVTKFEFLAVFIK